MADEKKEPMIGQDQRPGQIDLDRPLADMKLRDLITILGGAQTLPEWIKPETLKPERIKPEQLKPETFKPEHFKEWVKPEWIKPESFKPENFKEFSKPELSKPFDIDQIFDPVIDALSKDQLKQLSEKIQRKLG